MDFDKWFNKHHAVKSAYGDAYSLGAERGFNAGKEIKQESINHMRDYLITGMQFAPENSGYWLALRDCLDELEGIMGKEK